MLQWKLYFLPKHTKKTHFSKNYRTSGPMYVWSFKAQENDPNTAKIAVPSRSKLHLYADSFLFDLRTATKLRQLLKQPKLQIIVEPEPLSNQQYLLK